MANILKICILPLDVQYADKQANFRNVAELLARVDADTDLLVLPELFSTGFVRKPERLTAVAEQSDGGDTLQFLCRNAGRYNMAIAGSFLAHDGDGHYYNRGVFVEPAGDVTFYDKRHLFSYSGEDTILTGGTTPCPVVRFRGWNFKLFICYDLRFPAWCRNRDLQYDVALYPANWPQSRAFAWHQLLMARAIENQAYVVGANRSGSDPFGNYPLAMSSVYDFMGQQVSQHSEGLVYAMLDHDALSALRHDFPVHRDADLFTI